MEFHSFTHTISQFHLSNFRILERWTSWFESKRKSPICGKLTCPPSRKRKYFPLKNHNASRNRVGIFPLLYLFLLYVVQELFLASSNNSQFSRIVWLLEVDPPQPKKDPLIGNRSIWNLGESCHFGYESFNPWFHSIYFIVSMWKLVPFSSVEKTSESNSNNERIFPMT